jgi:hypothetical protein
MAKIFDVDFRKGSLIDNYTKEVGTITGSTISIKNKNKGKSCQFTNQTSPNERIDYTANSVNVGAGAISFVIGLNYKKTGNFQTILCKDQFSDDIEINTTNADKVRFFIDSNETSSGTITEGDHLLVCTRTSAGVTNIYLDGVSIATKSGVTNSINNAKKLVIGSRGVGLGGVNTYGSGIYYVRIFDNALSTAEINKLYTEFLHSSNLAKAKRNYKYNKPNDLSNET